MPMWQHWRLLAPTAVALYTENGVYTWQTLCEEVDHVSEQLYQQGVRAQDIVTIVGKNHPHMLLIMLAAHQLGVTCALTMPQPTALLARKLVTLYPPQCSAFVWFSPDLTLPDDIQEMPRDLQCVTITSLRNSPDSSPVQFSTHTPHYAPHNLASLIFTSGSTGTPKAVAHTHEQHFASATGLLQWFSFKSQDCWLLSLPLYHVSGLSIVYRWLAVGASLKVGQGTLHEDMAGVTHASLVPLQLQRLLDSEQSLCLSRVLLGGSHIPQELALRAAALGIETWLGYGMTEAASTVTARQVQQGAGVGTVLPNRRLMVCGQRILLSGATLASGYYHQGTLTSLLNQDGWFDTQDLGYWQESGQLVILGRADNQFISGGENIHCEEIEAVLTQHAAVHSAIVVPINDVTYGARPVAIIKANVDVTALDWSDWCQGKLEKFKWPVAYYAMPSHLDSGSIKPPRRALQDWLLQCHFP
ncbi:MAG: o-succinylbenzoate--CoA ligase [Vibrio sp.]